MRISEAYGPDRFGLSFELFPPKTEKGVENLYSHVETLMAYRPSFVTCTYGAGGSTRNKTLDIVTSVKRRFNVPVASHLTCVGATIDQLREFLSEAAEREVDNIVALRGDPPKGETSFRATEGGLRYANELVCLIRDEFPQFGVAVAGYPETHQEAESSEIDLANLKHKVACGADAVITQLFYQNEDFFRFRDRCVEAGIDVPIVPGLLPITNLKQIQRITSLCKAYLPNRLCDRLAERDDTDWQFDVGVEFAIEQTKELIEADVPGIHFYVLNKSQATSRVLDEIGRCNEATGV